MLVGCNLAYEIANDNFAEGTVGCRDQKYYRVLHDIFKSPTFRVVVTEDADCVEICSTLRVSYINHDSSIFNIFCIPEHHCIRCWLFGWHGAE